MPSIDLSYINIALDAFAFVVVLIIFATCFGELITKNSGSKHFLFLLSFVMLALVADIVSWIGEGHPSFSYMTVVSNTVASCAGQLAIIYFMGYLKDSLYKSSRAVEIILNIFRVLCVFSLAFSVINAFGGYAYHINEQGHYIRSENIGMGILYLIFPILSFFAIVLMSVFATRSAKTTRMVFVVYTLFPVAGITLDYIFHGISLTYVGLTVSTLTIYTSIYLQKQKMIDAQRNALMLSQINPHFVHNTLSTIAAMCDTSPQTAKALTIDFSRYLRQNLNTLNSEELIPFDKELEHVECYLKIEKARFRERLNVIYSVQCKDFEIPPLSVQPLVENAVKHGITKKAEGGTVRISTYSTDTHYIIEIIDDGVGFDASATEMHVGIENVKNRLGSMCKGTVELKSTLGVGTRVTIEIPKKKGKR